MSSNEPRLLRRDARCGEVDSAMAEASREIVLTGWVHRRRDLGQLIFIDLRDATGMVQVVFDPSTAAEAHSGAEALRQEYVVGVRGTVVRRESPNPKHPTGQIEVKAAELVLHNRAEAVPFPVEERTEAHEEARLTHRYVDLRRPPMQRALRTRHAIARAARGVLDDQGFVEVETPMLTRSTPEGARDYLVPSRVHPGRFYALPQSPQLFKQLLMVAGYDRYYQFARCFRDEDLRADRQPEFTQIDVEMSFVTPEDVYEVVERVIAAMFDAVGVGIERPFPRLCYTEAMDRFGVDRPDMRFAMELADAAEAAAGSGFKVFENVLEAGGVVRGLAVEGGSTASRKQLDGWTERARQLGAGGLVWIKWEADGTMRSPALKALGEEGCRCVAAAVGAAAGDLALIVADQRAVTDRVLGALRLELAEEFDRIPADVFHPVWVEEFPLLDRDDDAGRWVAVHHPFTAPRWDELELLETDPGNVRSQAYDLVLNGTEIAGGSIRIHRRDVQERVFRAMAIGEEEAEEKFGFLLGALRSGAPPHGGIAFGFDRICALLGGFESIRDVIAFPKTTSASDLMTRAPSSVDDAQLEELGLSIVRKPEVDS